MAFTIQGTTIIVPQTTKADGTKEAGKITGAEAKQAAQQMGITLQEGAFDETQEYTEAQVNNMIMYYASTRNALSTMVPKTSTGDKDQVISDLKAKYSAPAPAAGVDPYSINNQQLVKFQEFLNSGEMDKLGEAFGRDVVIDIINAVFPSIGISNGTNNDYSIPNGHGGEASAIFKQAETAIASLPNTSPEIVELENQLKAKTSELNKNLNTIKNLATQANQLADEIEKEVNKAIDESKQIEQQYKSEAKTTVTRKINEYANSNGEMTFEEFQSGLGSALDAIDPSGKLSAVVQRMTRAENKMAALTNIVKQIGTLNTKNVTLREDIGNINEQISIKKAELAAKEVKRTDPIGFTMADGTRIDFMIDKDKNGLLSNEQEFLGAERGWAEMEEIDSKFGNNDGKVTFDELKAAGITVVSTKTDGTQKVGTLDSVLAKGDSIDLSSYQTNGMQIGDTNNILQGTFTLNKGNEKIEGYQTLDDLNWLDKNYEFSDEDEGIGRFAKGNVDAVTEKEIMASDFDAKISELEGKLEKGWNELGIQRSTIKDKIQSAYDTAARNKANAIKNQFEGKGGTTPTTPTTPTAPTKATTKPTKPTGATTTPTAPTTPTTTYKKYDGNVYMADLGNLKRATNPDGSYMNATQLESLCKELTETAKTGGFSPDDTLSFLKEIRDNYNEGLFRVHNDFDVPNQTCCELMDAHEQDAQGIAQAKGLYYEPEGYRYANLY